MLAVESMRKHFKTDEDRYILQRKSCDPSIPKHEV